MLHEWLLKYYPCVLQACVRKGQNSALFSFFLGAILDCNAEFPQWHGLEENHVSCEAAAVSHTFSSSFFFRLRIKIATLNGLS